MVLATLILGIGLNTTIFSVLNAVLLRPLPVFQPDRIVWLHSIVNQTGGQLATSYPDFLDWRAQNHSFEAMAAMYFFSFTMTGNGPPQHLKATAISSAGFNVWGVKTILGRDFTEGDDQTGVKRVVILTYAFWQRKFGGNPDILEKSLVLDGQQYTVVGVLQPTQINLLSYPDVYVTNGPLLNPHIMERDTRWFFPIGRLNTDVNPAQAQAEMATIASRLTAQYTHTNKDMGVRIEGLAEQLTSDGRKPLLLLFIASSLIFLLACVNVLAVFLSSVIERAQELTIRIALGSQRSPLIRQFFIHAFILAAMGGALGLLFARATLAFLLHRFPSASQRFHETTIDSTVIAVTLAFTLGITLLASLLPAIHALRLNITDELRGQWNSPRAPQTRAFRRSIFIGTEITLACGLSLISGLLIKSFYQVQKVDLGFNPHEVLSFQITPPAFEYKDAAKQSALYRESLEKLSALPGIQSASGISSIPLTTQALVNTLETETQPQLPGHQLLVEEESILPGLFRLLRLPLLQGRDFTPADRESSSPVIIVDDLLASKLWPGQNPLGKHVRMSLLRGGGTRWLEVIGVVREIKHFGPEREVKWMQVYVPQYQDPSPVLSFLITTTLPSTSLKTEIENAIHGIDSNIPVEGFETLDNYLDRNFLAGRKLSLLILSVFAGIGISLGLIGVYGMVANGVVKRRREIAVRMALGATASKAILLVVHPALATAAIGVTIGSLIVVASRRLLASLLFGISPLDPTIYAVTAAVVITLATLASTLPALRLLRLNIQETLRQ